MAGQSVVVVSSPSVIRTLQTRSSKQLAPIDYQKLEALTGLPRSRVPRLFEIIHHGVFTVVTRPLTPRLLPAFTSPTASYIATALADYLPETGEVVPVDMVSLIPRIIYNASMLTFWGEGLANTFDDFHEFDENLYPVMFGLPFGKERASRARTRLLSAITAHLKRKWNDSEIGGALEGAPEEVSNGIRMLKQKDVCEEDISCVIFTIIWGTHANMIAVSIWLMIYLTSDPYSFVRVREAVRTAYPSRIPDVSALSEDALDVPILDSAIKETLRLVTLPTTCRRALVDLTIVDDAGRQFVIQQGEDILYDTRGVHHDHVFHPMPHVFQVDRFVDKEVKYGDYNGAKTLIPWGGGIFMVGNVHSIILPTRFLICSLQCKGREYAQRVIKLFFIMFFQLYDVALEGYTLPGHRERSISTARPNYIPSLMVRRRSGSIESTVDRCEM